MSGPTYVYVIEQQDGQWLAIARSKDGAQRYVDSQPALSVRGYRIVATEFIDAN